MDLDTRQAEVLARLFLVDEPDGSDAAADEPLATPGLPLGPHEVGRRIGRYRILRVLGRGGMSTVYEAEQARPRRSVALKVLEAGAPSPPSLRRFELECSSLARLRHPGIAEVYEAGLDGEPPAVTPYIAMELVPGARDVVGYARDQELDPAACARLFAGVCDAVHHGHQRGVIHRDLKPANILVERNGRTKVIDFGVAHATDDEVTLLTAHTRAGQLVGTLPYMSPEQCTGGPEAVDVRCDVYALGVVLYEMLCGRRPHDVSHRALPHAIRTICEADPPRPGDVRRELRGDLEAIVLTALARDPATRYQSAAELAEDLRRYVRAEPVVCARPGRLARARAFVRRHRTLVAGSVLVGGLLLALVGVLAWAALTQRGLLREAQRAREEAREVETLAIGFLTELATELGTSTARRPMWEALYERLAAEVERHPDDEPARLNLARVAGGLADVEQEEGHLDRADALLREALPIRETAAAAAPDDGAAGRELSHNLVRIGDVAKERGDRGEAAAWYARALAIDEALVARHPGVARYADDLSWSYDRLGHLAQELGRLDEAHAWLTRRHDLIERLCAAEPDNLTRVAGACTSHLMLAELGGQRGKDRAVTARHLDAAIELARRLVDREPDNRIHLATLANALTQMATMAGRNAAFGEARRLVGEALTIRERLAQGEPDVLVHRSDLATTLARSAQIEDDAGDLEAGEARSGRAAELWRGLAAGQPANPLYCARLAETLGIHYWSCVKLGAAERAEAVRREVVARRRELAAAPGSSTADRARLAEWLALAPDRADREEALAIARRALAENDPPDPWALYALAFAEHALDEDHLDEDEPGEHAAAAARWLAQAEARLDPADRPLAVRLARLRATLEATGGP